METKVGAATQQFKSDFVKQQTDLQNAQQQRQELQQQLARERRDHQRELAVLRECVTEAQIKAVTQEIELKLLRSKLEADSSVQSGDTENRCLQLPTAAGSGQ